MIFFTLFNPKFRFFQIQLWASRFNSCFTSSTRFYITQVTIWQLQMLWWNNVTRIKLLPCWQAYFTGKSFWNIPKIFRMTLFLNLIIRQKTTNNHQWVFLFLYVCLYQPISYDQDVLKFGTQIKKKHATVLFIKATTSNCQR